MNTEPEEFPKLIAECPHCCGTGANEPLGQTDREACGWCDGTGEVLTPFGLHVRKSLEKMGFIPL